MEVVQAALMAALKLSAPVLIISMLVGLVISILQAATQIHEQTITFVPKLLTIAAVIIILGPWMMETMNDFVSYIFSVIQKLS
jgi:flagellar biosynthesis protein FliQ